MLLGRRQLFADLRRYGDVDRQCPPPGTPTLLIKVDIPNPDGALQSGGLLHCRVKDLAQIAGADRACLGDDLQSKRQAGAVVKNGIVDLHRIAITTDHGTSVQVAEGSKTAAR